MDQRISLVTLGVGDLGRARTFYAALGWHGQEVEETVFFRRVRWRWCSGTAASSQPTPG